MAERALTEHAAPYSTASDAYGAIHRALSEAVAAALLECEYDFALEYAGKMRAIEEHTDV